MGKNNQIKMRLEETLGIDLKKLYHSWVIVVLADVVLTQMWFHGEDIGGVNKTPWITIGPLHCLGAGAVCLMYITELFIERDAYFWKFQVYNALQALVFFICVAH